MFNVFCSVLVAEVWAAHDTFMHVWRLEFYRIELELDNKIVVKILEGDSSALADNALVARLHELLARERVIRVSHISHVRNVVADGLARTVRGREIGKDVYLQPPSKIVSLLIANQFQFG
ncbi:hypothetical protein V6N11_065618 [Hibiscus sabdariffa]|uniref:RNase H type-1 domain-containing protein n=1 Tax=Hibiscus sabdariffa TaxID=183260 RepID=A0ABR2PHV1_9ROSI